MHNKPAGCGASEAYVSGHDGEKVTKRTDNFIISALLYFKRGLRREWQFQWRVDAYLSCVRKECSASLLPLLPDEDKNLILSEVCLVTFQA